MKGGVTQLVFLPDRKTFILLESALAPEELARAVLHGRWQPPHRIRQRRFMLPSRGMWLW